MTEEQSPYTPQRKPRQRRKRSPWMESDGRLFVEARCVAPLVALFIDGVRMHIWQHRRYLEISAAIAWHQQNPVWPNEKPLEKRAQLSILAKLTAARDDFNAENGAVPTVSLDPPKD